MLPPHMSSMKTNLSHMADMLISTHKFRKTHINNIYDNLIKEN